VVAATTGPRRTGHRSWSTIAPLQYIDARDLAAWMLHCAETQVGGIFNTVSPVGHTTMGE